jgi:hypothetical protein
MFLDGRSLFGIARGFAMCDYSILVVEYSVSV